MLKKGCIVGCIAAMIIILSFHSAAVPFPTLPRHSMETIENKDLDTNDDDPEGKDGPDDARDLYYLICGMICLALMPRGLIKLIQNIGNPGEFISWLLGDFIASAYVVTAFLEAFDYKDVDGDGF